MMRVKNIFFLTMEETEREREYTGNHYIDYLSPHFELENGSIIYGCISYPAAGERYWDVVGFTYRQGC